ncbi:archease [Candidatus Omnitrophota bacterium]
MKQYEIIDHTADIGIRVYGADLKELFINAGHGMFEIIADNSNITATKCLKIELTAENTEELFVGWLRELLYQFNANLLILKDISIHDITPQSIKASVWCDTIDKARHSILTEIKAVTYHELKVEHIDSHWQAQVIFDV